MDIDTGSHELDMDNVEFIDALETIKSTKQSLYLTGKAGTGKTTFLKELKKYTKKNMIIVAPTGVAAINAGGSTIHSFFKIKPNLFTPDDKRLRVKVPKGDSDPTSIYETFRYNNEQLKILRKLDILIIDEASMVRCDLLDLIDKLLRVFRTKKGNELNVPFGGVQILMIGDVYQLPPVVKNDEWGIMKKWYKSAYFFDALCYKSAGFKSIELKKIYRQKDNVFIELLNRVRNCKTTQADLELLNNKYNPSFSSTKDKYITLTTHNDKADAINEQKLKELKEEEYSFEADTYGNFRDNIFPAPKTLRLKKGAQVMFLRNSQEQGYWNGALGVITGLSDYGITIELNGKSIDLDMAKWENIEYIWNSKTEEIEENVAGSFIQYPIRLAWAITVHKSQGMTFNRAIVDLDKAFAPGQVYVALSRCTSLQGLVLKSKIAHSSIKTDKRILEFSENSLVI